MIRFLLLLLILALPAQAQEFVSPGGDTLYVVRDTTGAIGALVLKGEQGTVIMQDAGLDVAFILPRSFFNRLKAMPAEDRRSLTALFDLFDTVW